jgi:hypothetical protein
MIFPSRKTDRQPPTRKEFDTFLRKSEHRVLNALEEIISKKNKLEN